MRKEQILLNETINRINELSGINAASGKDLLVVDIQPEYEGGFKYFLYEFISFLNENYTQLNRLTFFFNGEDTLGMIPESEYRMWWIEHGLEEEIVDSARFYDKGYAFFRYCIDSGIDDESTTNLVKFMIEKDVHDSRDLGEEFWTEFVERYGHEDVKELLEISGDCIHIPDLMEELQYYHNIVLCGGGINECLKEVEIALSALDKPFNVLTKYTY